MRDKRKEKYRLFFLFRRSSSRGSALFDRLTLLRIRETGARDTRFASKSVTPSINFPLLRDALRRMTRLGWSRNAAAHGNHYIYKTSLSPLSSSSKRRPILLLTAGVNNDCATWRNCYRERCTERQQIDQGKERKRERWREGGRRPLRIAVIVVVVFFVAERHTRFVVLSRPKVQRSPTRDISRGDERKVGDISAMTLVPAINCESLLGKCYRDPRLQLDCAWATRSAGRWKREGIFPDRREQNNADSTKKYVSRLEGLRSATERERERSPIHFLENANSTRCTYLDVLELFLTRE